MKRSINAGGWAVAALAVLLTGWDYWLLVLSNYDVAPVLVVMQCLAVPGLWLAAFAWFRSKWLLAGVGLLAGLFGGWGYFYLPPLACLVLAGIAFWQVRRPRSSA